MGQITSRRRVRSNPKRRSSRVTPPSEPIAQNEPNAPDTQPNEDITTASPNTSSGRSSRRQSLRELISTKTLKNLRNHEDRSTAPASRRSSRNKPWPTSRRWSMAPEQFMSQSQEMVASISEDATEALDVPFASSSTNGMERENVNIDTTPVESPATPLKLSGPSIPITEAMASDLDLAEDEPSTSSNIGSWIGGQGSLAQNLGFPNLEEEEVVISPSTFAEEQDDNADADGSAETTDERQAPTQPVQNGHAPIPAPLPVSPQPAFDAQPHRQFPPPGTLVVVQGVVHTTDVSRLPPPPSAATLSPPNTTPMSMSGNPRRASSFIPRPSPPSQGDVGFPRSRRVSVIPRPSSMRARPASMFDSSTVAESTAESNSDSEPNLLSDVGNTPTTSGFGSDTRTSVASESGPPVLSPSSIDVLGTLLSVAAAATAASLLTGSSDPIFTSGLNPPSNRNTTVPRSNTNNTNNFERPTSPTPTAGLGNLGSLSAGLGLGTAEAAPQAYGNGRQRIRHVWGTLRDRLGRRTGDNGNAASGNEQQIDINDQPRPNGTPIDAREVMLAEMARAFNLGLGLSGAGAAPDTGAGTNSEGNSVHQGNGDSPSVMSPPPGGAAQLPELPLPAEGSFERFLMDLQADLRVALSSQDPPANQLPYTQRSENRPPSPIPSSSRPTTVIDQNAQPPAEEATGLPDTPSISLIQDLPALPPPSQAFVSTSSPLQNDVVEGDREAPEIGPLPPPAVTRSDSESDAADGDLPGMSETPRVPLDASPSGANAVVESGLTSRTERRPGGGINWWRSYRFPPITTPHVHGLSTTLSSTNSATSPLAASDPPSETSTISSSSAPLASPSSSTQDSGPSTLPAAENRPNTVVPLIVVGLQSVMDRGREQAPPFGDDNDTYGLNHNEPESSDIGGDVNIDDMPSDGDPGALPGSPRARTWHSRAANAFRQLRPGRRPTQAAQTNDVPGSRTFLIYVIGGYYPPDHGLITGANALDSFEALWELAELLGSVKPQTVSKEEIDNSGLEIIQTTVLEQYEKEGKVASNCIERCLICLDDYEPETDLRLLNCKHAFHKHCVDQWLQTGKNNCPACRTKGVSTGSESTPTSPATSLT